MDKVFVGIFVFLSIASGTPVGAQRCDLRDYFKCASLIDKMEHRDTIVNNVTCVALNDAINCIRKLWRDCDYDCTGKYKDYSHNPSYACEIHYKMSFGPMNENYKSKEHPCVVLQNLEDCIENCHDRVLPPGVTPGPSYVTPFHLNKAQFNDQEIKTLEAQRMCSSKIVEMYAKPYESVVTRHLDATKCTEIKTSLEYYVHDLGEEKTGGKDCSGTEVQQMVVDVVTAGMNRYVKYCDDNRLRQSSSKPLLEPGSEKCSLKDYFKCASLVDNMESRETLVANKTCVALKEAISCVKGLWQDCGYDCSKEYKDYITTVGYSCEVHSKLYEGPMRSNLEWKEHPCVVLKNLEDCVNSCQQDTSIKGSAIQHLSLVSFTDEEIDSLQDMRKCSHDIIDKYARKFESTPTAELNPTKCTEIRVSKDYYMEALRCSGSKVQQMVVDIVGAGLNRYLGHCNEECQGDKCQASSLSSSIVAILFVVIGYILDN